MPDDKTQALWRKHARREAAGIDPASGRLRQGTQVGRTLYVHSRDDPKGRLVGVMDTPELAALVCDAVNARLDATVALAEHAAKPPTVIPLGPDGPR